MESEEDKRLLNRLLAACIVCVDNFDLSAVDAKLPSYFDANEFLQYYGGFKDSYELVLQKPQSGIIPAIQHLLQELVQLPTAIPAPPRRPLSLFDSSESPETMADAEAKSILSLFTKNYNEAKTSQSDMNVVATSLRQNWLARLVKIEPQTSLVQQITAQVKESIENLVPLPKGRGAPPPPPPPPPPPGDAATPAARGDAATPAAPPPPPPPPPAAQQKGGAGGAAEGGGITALLESIRGFTGFDRSANPKANLKANPESTAKPMTVAEALKAKFSEAGGGNENQTQVNGDAIRAANIIKRERENAEEELRKVIANKKATRFELKQAIDIAEKARLPNDNELLQSVVAMLNKLNSVPAVGNEQPVSNLPLPYQTAVDQQRESSETNTSNNGDDWEYEDDTESVLVNIPITQTGKIIDTPSHVANDEGVNVDEKVKYKSKGEEFIVFCNEKIDLYINKQITRKTLKSQLDNALNDYKECIDYCESVTQMQQCLKKFKQKVMDLVSATEEEPLKDTILQKLDALLV